MSHESLVVAPRSDLVIENIAAQLPAAHLPLEAQAAPTTEQIQTADGVFVDPAENRAVVGLLSVWTGTMLLHDLMAEHLARPREEEQQPVRLKPRPEEPTV
jgi:hypothetical protein